MGVFGNTFGNTVGGRGLSQFDESAPSLLNITRNISTEIDLAWTVNSSNLEGSRIYRSTDGTNFTELAIVSGSTSTYTATGLTAGGLYYFKVVSYKGVTETAATNIYDTRFKFTVDTTKAGSANNVFVLPCSGSGYDFYIDWENNGTIEHIVGTPGNVSHIYSSSGIYNPTIYGTFRKILFNNSGDKLKFISLDNWGITNWSSTKSAFYGCANMIANYVDCPNTSAVTDMSVMFHSCALFNGAVNFNTANVIDMSDMFRSCTNFNKSVSGFDTAKVANMSQMFFAATNFNQSVSNFNTANVTAMGYMFATCPAFNQSLANFNTAKVTSFTYMFNNCTAFKQSLANFNIALCTNFIGMCNGCDINVTETSTNYDNTLIAWADQTVSASEVISFGTSKYSSGLASTARDVLTNAPNLWTITDGGIFFLNLNEDTLLIDNTQL